MRYLIDSCTLIWLLKEEKIPAHVRELFLDIKNERYVSHVSIWEIAAKDGRKPFGFKQPFEKLIEKECYNRVINLLPIEYEDYFASSNLPQHHGDPFDRMLVAQAKRHKMIIMTPDKSIRQYKVSTVW